MMTKNKLLNGGKSEQSRERVFTQRLSLQYACEEVVVQESLIVSIVFNNEIHQTAKTRLVPDRCGD